MQRKNRRIADLDDITRYYKNTQLVSWGAFFKEELEEDYKAADLVWD